MMHTTTETCSAVCRSELRIRRAGMRPMTRQDPADRDAAEAPLLRNAWLPPDLRLPIDPRPQPWWRRLAAWLTRKSERTAP